MGSGASRQEFLQRSDSRVDALLAEARKNPEDERLLELALAKIPPGMRVELCDLKRPNTERSVSYLEEGWCHDATTSLNEAELRVHDEVRDKSEEKSGRNGEDEEGYSTDDFEDDEVTKWKKGASIGAGSCGTVYLARDEDTGSLMAVKELLISEETDRAIREATREVKLLRSLKHENIVKYLGCHVDNEAHTLSIFTEWVPGGSLEHNRKLFGGNERVVRRFTYQLLSGVAYLHSMNIIHHDIKPANILVDQNGVVKIADFGSSRLINSATMPSNGSTQSLHGTPNYMAPEVIKQTCGRSRKADIWSIGCTVLRLLTGGPLWGDRHFDSQAALLYYIANLQELPALPEGFSPEAQEFILACLQIDPALRPSAAELLKFPFVRHARQKPEPVAPEPVSRKTARRHTAPEVASPSSSKSGRHSRRSERHHRHDGEAPKQTETTVKTTPAPLKRKPSLVATLFAPVEANSSLPEEAPEKEVEEENAVEITPDEDCEAEVTLATHYTQEDATESSKISGDLVVTSWDEQPILSALAQKDRAQLQAEAAEAARQRQERERKFQEEVEAYRHEIFTGLA